MGKIDLITNTNAVSEYLEYFTKEERIASLMDAAVGCKIRKCELVVGFTDVINWYDHVEYRCLEHSKHQRIRINCGICGIEVGSSETPINVDLVSVICANCKLNHYTSKKYKWDTFRENMRKKFSFEQP